MDDDYFSSLSFEETFSIDSQEEEILDEPSLEYVDEIKEPKSVNNNESPGKLIPDYFVRVDYLKHFDEKKLEKLNSWSTKFVCLFCRSESSGTGEILKHICENHKQLLDICNNITKPCRVAVEKLRLFSFENLKEHINWVFLSKDYIQKAYGGFSYFIEVKRSNLDYSEPSTSEMAAEPKSQINIQTEVCISSRARNLIITKPDHVTPEMELKYTDPIGYMKHRFYLEVKEHRRRTNKADVVCLSDEAYERLVDNIVNNKLEDNELHRNFRVLYGVTIVDGKYKLFNPSKTVNNKLKLYAADSELFDLIDRVHLSTMHGSKDRMMRIFNEEYVNICRTEVDIYLRLCKTCNRRRNPNNFIFPETDYRCQIDTMSYEHRPDGEYKFILKYQDLMTNYIILKPLKTIDSEEILQEVIPIFVTIGAPPVIQSQNGKKFVFELLNGLQVHWPRLKVIYGTTETKRPIQVNEEVEEMVNKWMYNSKSNNWSKGVCFVQLEKNNSYDPELKKSPFEALFAFKRKFGFTQNLFPGNILETVQTEEQLKAAIISDSQRPSTSTANLTE